MNNFPLRPSSSMPQLCDHVRLPVGGAFRNDYMLRPAHPGHILPQVVQGPIIHKLPSQSPINATVDSMGSENSLLKRHSDGGIQYDNKTRKAISNDDKKEESERVSYATKAGDRKVASQEPTPPTGRKINMALIKKSLSQPNAVSQIKNTRLFECGKTVPPNIRQKSTPDRSLSNTKPSDRAENAEKKLADTPLSGPTKNTRGQHKLKTGSNLISPSNLPVRKRSRKKKSGRPEHAPMNEDPPRKPVLSPSAHQADRARVTLRVCDSTNSESVKAGSSKQEDYSPPHAPLRHVKKSSIRMGYLTGAESRERAALQVKKMNESMKDSAEGRVSDENVNSPKSPPATYENMVSNKEKIHDSPTTSTSSSDCEIVAVSEELLPLLPIRQDEKGDYFLVTPEGTPEKGPTVSPKFGPAGRSPELELVSQLTQKIINEVIAGLSPPKECSEAQEPDPRRDLIINEIKQRTADILAHAAESEELSTQEIIQVCKDGLGPFVPDTQPDEARTRATTPPLDLFVDDSLESPIRSNPTSPGAEIPESQCGSQPQFCGSNLRLFLPPASPITCPVCEECDWETRPTNWMSTTLIIELHLKEKHDMADVRFERWCNTCEAEIQNNIFLHPCFRDLNFLRCGPRPYECDRCDAKFAAKPLFEVHLKSHASPHKWKEVPSSRPECPSETCRTGRRLNFVFPILGPLKCTEEGCSAAFRSGSWALSRNSLLAHLMNCHNIREPRQRKWCNFCREQIKELRYSDHPCLKGTRFFRPEVNDAEVSTFHCDRCEFRCPSKRGLTNHKRTHMREPRRKVLMQRIPVVTVENPPPPETVAPEVPPSDTSQPDPDSQQSDQTLQNTPDVPELGDENCVNNVNTVQTPNNEPEQYIASDPDQPSPSDEYTQKFAEIFKNQESTSWDTFTDLVADYISYISDLAGFTQNDERTPNIRQTNPRDPIYIQRLYRRNRRRAIRLLTKGEGASCQVPQDALATHFYANTTESFDLDFFSNVKKASTSPKSDKFSAEEVWAKLKGSESTAPGPDRITYGHWKSFDPEGRTLALIFSLCLKFKSVPEPWRESKTIFIPKNDEGATPADWRPIALGNTIAKLFAACVAKRINVWAEEFGVISHCQKGFMAHDGTFEHNYVLEHSLSEARANRRDLCVASLDIKNAFGSVPHEAVFAALRSSGVNDTLLQVIKAMYTDSSTQLLTADGISEPVQILNGVRQGCPLSGILFNLTIDPIIRAIQQSAEDYHVLAYADDLLLLESNSEALQASLDNVFMLAMKIGLKLNPGKCVTLHLGSAPVRCVNTVFLIDNVPIRCLQNGEIAPFLGKPFGYNIAPSSENLQEFAKLGESVLTSFLAPWQRLDALKAFVFPAFSYAMRTGQHLKSDWDKVDAHLRPLIKETINCPSRAANAYIYGSRAKGHLNIPMCSEDSEIAKIDGAFKLLTSNDTHLRNIAWADLTNTVKVKIKGDPTPEALSDFMSGAPIRGTNPTTSIWTQAREASKKLKVLWNLHADHKVSVSHGDYAVTDRKKVFKSLRETFRKQRSNEMLSKPHQGKTFPLSSKSLSSSHFLSEGKFTRFADWRFIHRARLGLVPLNGYDRRGEIDAQKCRRCGFKSETLPHVINHCMPHMRKITDRHNRIVTRVKVAASRRWKVLAENTVVAGLKTRPDLVLVNGDSVIILDVTVPFENGEDAFRIARSLKEEKYAALASELSNRYKQVRVEALVVGALGSWDPSNDKLMKRLCTTKYAKLFRKLVVSDTIRASREIFNFHVTGIEHAPAPPLQIAGMNEDGNVVNNNVHNSDQVAPVTGRSRYGRRQAIVSQSRPEPTLSITLAGEVRSCALAPNSAAPLNTTDSEETMVAPTQLQMHQEQDESAANGSRSPAAAAGATSKVE